MKFKNMKAPAGYVYLIVIAHYWGKGASIADAMTALRKAGGDASGDCRAAIYLADPDARLDDFGQSIERPSKGKESVLISEVLP